MPVQPRLTEPIIPSVGEFRGGVLLSRPFGNHPILVTAIENIRDSLDYGHLEVTHGAVSVLDLSTAEATLAPWRCGAPAKEVYPYFDPVSAGDRSRPALRGIDPRLCTRQPSLLFTVAKESYGHLVLVGFGSLNQGMLIVCYAPGVFEATYPHLSLAGVAV